MLKAFQDFYHQLEYCDWEIPSDIMKSFRTADLINCEGRSFNRLVFNIGGNKYRMICGYKFGTSKVVLYVRFAGTHKEYDKVDICQVNIF
ncbi:addiction module toxin RelE [Flavilitoribacter nigricans DSM 23189 = NBRC 102662]|uniref:Addiction module toxin RelE n=2 Tax=Flavilitoribacter TaxID=2762562 RepID=A0A2D0N5N3_FLAN2|nr:addiction module toxin RelE [Flavilitoribacter nigricans DSM 23189 = NBRC 102662]